jgi:hypothetical protein
MLAPNRTVCAKASAVARHGSIAPTRFERLSNDSYFTLDAPWIVPALLSKVEIIGPVLEPAAGAGHLVRELRRGYGLEVIASDLHAMKGRCKKSAPAETSPAGRCGPAGEPLRARKRNHLLGPPKEAGLDGSADREPPNTAWRKRVLEGASAGRPELLQTSPVAEYLRESGITVEAERMAGSLESICQLMDS